MAFDINDRSTWAWIDDAMGKPGADGELRIHKENPERFYQFSHGVAYVHDCPIRDGVTGARLVWNPRINTCDWPENVPEADVYEWAVDQGLVKDQR